MAGAASKGPTCENTTRDLYQDRHAYVWNNDSDTAALRNDHHRFVNSRSWVRQRR